MSSATSTTITPTTDPTYWDIDVSHSSVHFAVRHMMVSNVRGHFTRVSGTVQVDPRDVTRSTVEVVIDAASIHTRDEKRDEHLRSADFLDVANFPTIDFKSTRVTRSHGDSLEVAGNLTIHGVTREVVLNVEESGERQDPWGNTRRGASATTKLNRKDFGLQWNLALETGGFLVGDELKVEIDVELVKK